MLLSHGLQAALRLPTSGTCPAFRHVANPSCLGPVCRLILSAACYLIHKKSIWESPLGCRYVGCLLPQLFSTTSLCFARTSRTCCRSWTRSCDCGPDSIPLPAIGLRASKHVLKSPPSIGIARKGRPDKALSNACHSDLRWDITLAFSVAVRLDKAC